MLVACTPMVNDALIYSKLFQSNADFIEDNNHCHLYSIIWPLLSNFTPIFSLVKWWVNSTAASSLLLVIHRRRSVEYNLANALSWISQLSEALAFLHERSPIPIIHRDVKPANCLILNEGTRLQLCDFGSAESPNLPEPMSPTRRGTAGFMAPELFSVDSTTSGWCS